MFRKLVKALIPRQLFRMIEPYGHLAEAVMWQVLMGFPARGLKVIGVTGTDGKTTTSTLIYTMLNEAGHKAGLMTTIGYGTPGHWRDNEMHMTTLPTRAMLRRIRELHREGIEWLVLETTSHALAQYRVWGVPYSLAVFTNLTHEHLDYHGTFERYREAKLRLFRLVARNKRGLRLGVVNADDPSAPEFVAAVPHVLTYGLGLADVAARQVEATPAGSRYQVTRDGQTLHVQVNLPGDFNVLNSLAAVGVGLALGLRPEQIEQGVAALTVLPGRMNRIDEGQKFAAIVDFAHTPESFERLLSQMRRLGHGRLIVLFGSAAQRDVAKRGIQGASAGRWADVVVITEEDDRDEDGQAILEQIARGAEAEGKVRDENLFLVHDRAAAIAFVVGQARAGDTVLFLGKGHEKTIERADGEHPWDEAAEVRRAIKALH
ncbi:MAG TPA: UDP-N-acetylmuramoyl-L-alanyl-D-glutamate--2,6-diaminopimelate ligase [Candidatus Saccharimonadia bacterium]|nr:UDP-N-acetylmuramoyl-L-alanyl-D-glutamate--2,6-diaminopimelate ligase [Candidatus Saccharimonadia bacterium]